MSFTEDSPLMIAFLLVLGLSGVASSQDIKLERKLLGSGFHRNLVTNITLPSTLKSSYIHENCGLLLLETLPAGVYADPFQLQSLAPFEGPKVVFTKEVSVEAAEYQSKPLQLYIFLNISEENKEMNQENRDYALSVSLPIHARYHRPSTDPKVMYAHVAISNPALYSNCSESSDTEGSFIGPCDHSDLSKCIWHYLPYLRKSSPILFEVPVGQQKHKAFVVLITLLVSVTVSGLLVKVICTVQNTHLKNL